MSESHDPWEQARAQQREEVAAIFAKRELPPVDDRRREFRLSRRNTAIVFGVIALVVLVAAIVIPGLRSDASKERAAERAKQVKLEAAERSRVIREQQPQSGPAPARKPGEAALAYRPRLIEAGAAAITADAKQRVAEGRIDDPIKGTQCTPYPTTQGRKAAEADPAAVAGRYECIAYERHFPLNELEGKARTGIIGTPFWLVINYDKPSLTWCRVIPRAGEGGRALAFVPAPAACQAP